MSTHNICYYGECCGYSLESPGRGNSNEYPQHMFLWRNMENYHQIHTLSVPLILCRNFCSILLCCKILKVISVRCEVVIKIKKYETDVITKQLKLHSSKFKRQLFFSAGYK